jgi:Spy/CpxP family protein refolding chaperone
MNAELDYDLTRDQWEVLKALRTPAAECRRQDRSAFNHLIALGLADVIDDRPVISAKGRSVLLRGSPRLWDLAA